MNVFDCSSSVPQPPSMGIDIHQTFDGLTIMVEHEFDAGTDRGRSADAETRGAFVSCSLVRCMEYVR